MDIPDIATFVEYSKYVIPGILYQSVFNLFKPSIQVSDFKKQLLSYVAFGIVYLSLIGALSIDSTTPLNFGVFIFLLPVFLGILLGELSARGVVITLLRFLRLSPVNTSPSGWDYRFARTFPLFVLVTLKSGSTIAGYFGTNSFAASSTQSSDSRDLYLEKTYVLNTDKSGSVKWENVDRSAGVWIDRRDIAFVEFWDSF